MTRLETRFPDQVHAWLRKEAYETGKSMNAIVVESVKAAMRRKLHNGAIGPIAAAKEAGQGSNGKI